MIDITFTIITFFLVFTVFRGTDAAMRLNLPKASSGDKGVTAPVVVTVTDQGEFFLQGRQVTTAELRSSLGNQVSAHPEQSVIIKADRDVKYQYLVDAMDAFRAVGGAHIALAVEREVQ
jgi:biopolymer transport protein ExbD